MCVWSISKFYTKPFQEFFAGCLQCVVWLTCPLCNAAVQPLVNAHK